MTSIGAPFSILSCDSIEALPGASSRFAALADRTGFVLLLLAVIALLIRPADLLPIFGGAPIYESLVIGCIIASLPSWYEQLRWRSLQKNSITALVLLLIPAVVLSHLDHANTYDARFGCIEIGKACFFFLLIVGVINSPRRLRAILWVGTACVFAEAFLAILQYQGFLHLDALQNVAQASYDQSTDESVRLVRLCGIGVFNDPNDFSLILVAAMVVCVYGLGEYWMGWARLLFLAPLLLLGQALVLTHSRGGFAAALAALLAFLPARFGWRNTVPLACLLVPLLIMSFPGRQTEVDLGNPEDTFQTRLDLWNDSLDQFRSAPLFGIGQGKLADQIGQVSHNSYVHAFAEMGLLGGSAFVGAFYLLLRGLRIAQPADPSLRRLHPYLRAVIASYAVGLLSLSRCYTVPTQMILALGTAYLMLAGRSGPVAIPQFDRACVRRVFAVGLLTLLGTWLFLRLMLERGRS